MQGTEVVEKMKSRWASLIKVLGHDRSTFADDLEACLHLERRVKGPKREKKSHQTSHSIFQSITVAFSVCLSVCLSICIHST